ncbi:MAG: NosD domain-containing protein [Candidatus Hodarchaeota archaeon]
MYKGWKPLVLLGICVMLLIPVMGHLKKNRGVDGTHPPVKRRYEHLSENTRGKQGRGVTQHAPIAIDGNAALATFIANEGLPGDGTSTSPYAIEGFLIDASTAHGIAIQATDAYLIIRNCTIDGESSNYNSGIFLDNVRNVQIRNNIVTNNKEYGIAFSSSNHITLSRNLITNNTEAGIALRSSSHITLSENIMEGSGVGLFGECFDNQIDTSNKVNAKAVRYYENTPGIRLVGESDVGQVILVNCNDALIAGLSISETSTGIALHDSLNCSISDNTIRNCTFSVALSSSNHSILTRNNASYNKGVGIHLDSSSYNTLAENTATNSVDGIILISSSYNTLAENNASYNEDAAIIVSWSSNNNMLTGNTATNNGIGIVLGNRYGGDTPSHNTTLIGNTARYNQGYGISLTSGYCCSLIQYNSFFNNNDRNTQASDDGEGNLFSHNFWDDGIGPDRNDDGIVDAPYFIDGSANNSDPFPLVHHFDVTIDPLIDTDDDGLFDVEEVYKYGTDPNEMDTDGDGLPDGEEVLNYYTDPTDRDSDGDGFSDFEEVKKYNSDPLDTDSDNDFFPDGWDVGWWGHPRRNWDNPLTRGLFLLLVLGSCGVLIWLGFIVLYLRKLRQDLNVLFPHFQQYGQQFQEELTTLQLHASLEEFEAAAAHLALTFHSYEIYYHFAYQVVQRKWLPRFLRPTLRPWDQLFESMSQAYSAFQELRLKQLFA